MKNYLLLLFIFHHLQADDFNALIKEYPSSTDSSKINIVVKDNIDIKGTVTSAGSFLSGSYALGSDCIFLMSAT